MRLQDFPVPTSPRSALVCPCALHIPRSTSSASSGSRLICASSRPARLPKFDCSSCPAAQRAPINHWLIHLAEAGPCAGGTCPLSGHARQRGRKAGITTRGGCPAGPVVLLIPIAQRRGPLNSSMSRLVVHPSGAKPMGGDRNPREAGGRDGAARG